MNNTHLLAHYIAPVVFIALGFIIPQCKSIGPIGYRTPRSMKNQQNWDFAQQLSGKFLLILGGIFLINNLLFYFSIFQSTYFSLSEIILLGGGLFVLILYVEIRLYRFDKQQELK